MRRLRTLIGWAGAMLALLPAAAATAQPSDRPAAQNPMAPELETALPPAEAWLNTDRPLRLAHELRGHVVLLDFWTHCCINCMHVLPDLEFLEHKHADRPFVVIGVHSAKFESEGDRASIRAAMFRHNIRHPVLIDTGMALWRRYGVRSWPTFVLIGADGRLIGFTSGEGKREVLDQAITLALEEARDRGLLAEERVRIIPDEAPRPASGLSFPGKVLAFPPDPALERSGLLFVSDSSHHRVVVATWPDDAGSSDLVDIFGSGEPSLDDGRGIDAGFRDPQGLAYDPALGAAGTLYVADTKNHAIRAIDLASQVVTTIAGTGGQSSDRRGGAAGRDQGLSSPWDLALTPDGRTLYVAMAGPHQLWRIDLFDEARATAIAGGMGENLVDGPARQAMLAQPSGLALSGDGRWLYFADAENSAIRLLDLERAQVGTIIGRGLFEFGDVDGAYPAARMQHCLGVTTYPTPEGERLLVADTYNHAIKIVDPFARTSRTLIRPGADDGALPLSEPAGLFLAPGTPDGARTPRLFIADTNNHRIVVADPETGALREVRINGLTPPSLGALGGDPTRDAIPTTIALIPEQPATLRLRVELPEGAAVNTEFPASVRLWRLPPPGTRTPPRVISQTTIAPRLPAEVAVPASAVRNDGRLLVELSFGWCVAGTSATCRPGQVAWNIRIHRGDSSVADLHAAVE